MNARAKRLRGLVPDGTDTLDALAIMLDAATKPEPKRARTGDEGAVSAAPLSPGQVLTALRTRANGAVITEPVDKKWFGWMSSVLKGIDGLQPADVDLVVDWLAAGGLASWPTGLPDLYAVAKWFPAWIGRAREWDRRGRQVLRGGNQVGAAPESTPESTWDAFRAEG